LGCQLVTTTLVGRDTMNSKGFVSLLVSILLIAVSVIAPVGVFAQNQGKTIVLQVNNTVATVNNESVTWMLLHISTKAAAGHWFP